jgi:hypothetical protein
MTTAIGKKWWGKMSFFSSMINEMRCFDDDTAYILLVVRMFTKTGLIPTAPLHYYCFAILLRNALRFFPTLG